MIAYYFIIRKLNKRSSTKKPPVSGKNIWAFEAALVIDPGEVYNQLTLFEKRLAPCFRHQEKK